MKGYLKTTGWLFKLNPNKTTIGRHRDCDLCLQNGGVEECHAIIAWSASERRFILSDLNSAHGTYVNDCRIHNAAVHLSPGDKLHFGYGGSTYQLHVDSSSLQLPYPPVTSKQGSHISLEFIEDLPLDSSACFSSSQLSLLPSHPLPPQAWGEDSSPVTPRPPSRAQPASAGARRNGNVTVPIPKRSWTGNTRAAAASESFQNMEHVFQKKEERLSRTEGQLRCLAAFKSECLRKDGVIAGLRGELAALAQRLSHSQTTTAAMPEVRRRLRCLETDISHKKEQILILQDQMVDLKRSSVEMTQQSVKERDVKIEKLRKSNAAMSGLASSLQRDLSAREKESVDLACQVDKLHQDITHKDIQLGANATKLIKMKEKHQEELLSYENTVAMLKKSIEQLEDTLSQKERCFHQRVAEVDSLRSEFEEKVKEQEALLSGAETERDAEQQRSRAQLEQLEKRIEYVRSQLVSLLHTSHCDTENTNSHNALSDQQLLEQVAQQLHEKEKHKSKVEELEGRLKQTSAEKDSLDKEMETLKHSLDACGSQIQEDWCPLSALEGLMGSLRGEGFSPALLWIQAPLVCILTAHLSLLQTATQALEAAGVKVSDSPEGMLHGIKTLGQEQHGNKQELQRLNSELEELRGLTTELREELNSTREELERQKQQVNRVQQEEESRQRELEELRGQLDALKHSDDQNLLQQEEQEQEEEVVVVRLRGDEEAGGGAAEECREEERRREEEEGTRREEEETRREEEETRREEEEKQTRYRVQEEEEYREQVRQHAHTIVALEQSWELAQQRAQHLEGERDALRAQLTAAAEKHQPVHSVSPADTSRPEEVADLELTVSSLRSSLAEVRQEAHDRGHVISTLSGELATATARITDMTGELSEQQKLELEHHRTVVVDQRTRLSALTQRLTLMSRLAQQREQETMKAQGELQQCRVELESRNATDEAKNDQRHDQTQKNDQRHDQTQKNDQRHDQTQKNDQRHDQTQKNDQRHDQTQKNGQRHDQTQTELTSAVSPPQCHKVAHHVSASGQPAKGSQCRGHRHQQYIQHQKEALAETRLRIKKTALSKSGQRSTVPLKDYS